MRRQFNSRKRLQLLRRLRRRPGSNRLRLLRRMKLMKRSEWLCSEKRLRSSGRRKRS